MMTPIGILTLQTCVRRKAGIRLRFQISFMLKIKFMAFYCLHIRTGKNASDEAICGHGARCVRWISVNLMQVPSVVPFKRHFNKKKCRGPENLQENRK
jgi:hypothetical protein